MPDASKFYDESDRWGNGRFTVDDAHGNGIAAIGLYRQTINGFKACVVCIALKGIAVRLRTPGQVPVGDIKKQVEGQPSKIPFLIDAQITGMKAAQTLRIQACIIQDTLPA